MATLSAVQIEDSKKFTIRDDTCNASAGTESSHAHGLKVIPDYYIVYPKGNGTVYESKAADATYIYLKASANSLAVRIIAFSRNLTVRD